MNGTKVLSTIGFVALAATPLAAQAQNKAKATATSKERPNVILILADDQGYADVGYVGNPNINTPELNKLCSQSQWFDNFHTGTTSAPTRSGLMTGRHGNRTGVWHTIGGRSIMDLDEYTMGQAFQDSGYATAMYGKWHLGDNYPYRPADRGFEDVLWHKGGGVGQTPDFFDNTYFEDTYFRGANTPEKQHGYCTDIFFNETERFIQESVAKEKPFFCYLALNAPHGPYNVDEKWAAPYRSNPDIVNPAFYGMISNIDFNIGKLRSMLERLDLDDNTIIIFFGDNGSAASAALDKMGYATRGFNGGLRGKKGMVYEGGHRQSMLMHVPGMRPAKNDELATYADIMPTLIKKCGLTPSKDVEFDGVDILSPKSRAGRVFVVDTQRKQLMEENKMYCVMKDDWRLINGNQLYNMANDREQRVNIASKYPEIVNELKAEYKKWWDMTSVGCDQRQPIPLKTNIKGDAVMLTCHDLHDLKNRPNVWNMEILHKGTYTAPGFWAVDIAKGGKFTLEAYRWPPESGLNLDASAPEGRKIPNGTSYPAGGEIQGMKSIKVMCGDKVIAERENFATNVPCVKFDNLKLPEGQQELRVHITDDKGKTFSAWYVKVICK